MAHLDLTADVVDLTRAVCDVRSESGDERELADAVEAALRAYDHLEVLRDGDAVVARTHGGKASRVVIAGHLDTVPVADNLPTRLEDGVVWGRGTVDMKAGVAVQLALAAELVDPVRDVTWVFYDHEEVAADLNGLGRIVREHPDWLAGDLAILGEPTNGGIEGGCNGTLRVQVVLHGVAAHSARPWTGRNAVHAAGEVLRRLEAWEPRTVDVDGLGYLESLNAVLVSGGTAGNVIPDRCVVTVNYRFAPSADVEQASAYVREVFDGYDVEIVDAAPGARPGLDAPAAREFAEAVLAVTGGAPAPKLGWTDVARFSALGVPAVNFGPGDPLLAHKDDERCPADQIRQAYVALRAWLTAA
ncbi:succinyl-diaminopimelate desuccinylase [Cellulomonas sp. HZM]|uniref:succinyl-diaminopimelate desuccinylase n=1 Tax=Cellulomonas sp. HZM TaxID=1454010 RepID=UPI00049310F1|nr:succinyl-diaminopimelate desuccinylase [Cellulomonas sp. HZM]